MLRKMYKVGQGQVLRPLKVSLRYWPSLQLIVLFSFKNQQIVLKIISDTYDENVNNKDD